MKLAIAHARLAVVLFALIFAASAQAAEERSENSAASQLAFQSPPQSTSATTQSPAGRGPQQFVFIRTVDPCSVVSDTNLLKSVAGSAIAKAFPFSKNNGPYRLTVSDPHLANMTCSPLHIWIDAHVRLERTDVLHVETHGTTSFDSVVVGHVVSTAPPSQAITSATFRSATMCFTDIHFDTFNLEDVPSAIDNWIRGQINARVTAQQQCRDVTAMISTFLATGGNIPPQLATNSPGTRAMPNSSVVKR